MPQTAFARYRATEKPNSTAWNYPVSIPDSSRPMVTERKRRLPSFLPQLERVRRWNGGQWFRGQNQVYMWECMSQRDRTVQVAELSRESSATPMLPKCLSHPCRRSHRLAHGVPEGSKRSHPSSAHAPCARCDRVQGDPRSRRLGTR